MTLNISARNGMTWKLGVCTKTVRYIGKSADSHNGGCDHLNDLGQSWNAPEQEDGLAMTLVKAAAGEYGQALLNVDHLKAGTELVICTLP